MIKESTELSDFVIYEAAVDDKGLVVDIQCWYHIVFTIECPLHLLWIESDS